MIMVFEDSSKISINKDHLEKLSEFAKMIYLANQNFNLTGLKTIEDIEKVLIMESINALNFSLPINSERWSSNVIDIGSGSGIPSIPLKILNDKINLTVIESSKKKSDFIKSTSSNLGFNVNVINDRAEVVGRDAKLREFFDISVSRAIGSLSVLAELKLPLLKIGGISISIKGVNISQEIINSEEAVKVNGGELNSYLRATQVSTVVVWKKVLQTPSKFPRKSGTPQKYPL